MHKALARKRQASLELKKRGEEQNTLVRSEWGASEIRRRSFCGVHMRGICRTSNRMRPVSVIWHTHTIPSMASAQSISKSLHTLSNLKTTKRIPRPTTTTQNIGDKDI
ncbi:hypothetical protein CR513_17800, partial [Mucuna pruriens]